MGEGQDEGDRNPVFTLTLILSPQGRGNKKHVIPALPLFMFKNLLSGNPENLKYNLLSKSAGKSPPLNITRYCGGVIIDSGVYNS